MTTLPKRVQATIFKVSTLDVSVAVLRNRPFHPLPDGVEGSSAGWVANDHPELFPGVDDLESTLFRDGEANSALYRWRMRIDSRKVPAYLISMRMEAAERARGKKLSKAEKREIREAVAKEVLPKLPATSRFYDVIACEGRTPLIVLCSCSASVRESFQNLILDAIKSDTVPQWVNWTQVDSSTPHPLLEYLSKEPEDEPLVATFDGDIRIQVGDECYTIEADPAISTETARELRGEGGILRRAQVVLTLDEPHSPVWGATVDTWRGAVTVDVNDREADGESDAEISDRRAANLIRFAEAWWPMVERCNEAEERKLNS